jgi:sugar phosphate isomerase/epimerase
LGVYLNEPGDLRARLHEVAALGFREVEIAGWHDRRPTEIRKALDEAGLVCKSAHWTMWENDADSTATIDAAVELGLEYLVTPLPSLMGKDWFQANETPAGERAVFEKMTLNDWRWNADWFNHVGGLAQKNNIQFVYQNHGFEFRKLGADIAFQELWRRTEPTRVKFELNCGWAVAGGYDPVEFLQRYGERVYLLHISDVGSRASSAPDAAIGKGVIDWPDVFAAAKAAGVRRYYIATPQRFLGESLKYCTTSL